MSLYNKNNKNAEAFGEASRFFLDTFQQNIGDNQRDHPIENLFNESSEMYKYDRNDVIGHDGIEVIAQTSNNQTISITLSPEEKAQLVNLDPTTTNTINWFNVLGEPNSDYTENIQIRIPATLFRNHIQQKQANYVALLGHNFNQTGVAHKLYIRNEGGQKYHKYATTSPSNINVNASQCELDSDGRAKASPRDGYTLLSLNNTQEVSPGTNALVLNLKRTTSEQGWKNAYTPIVLGCISYGNVYTLPYGVSANSSLEYSFKGSYEQTKNFGASHVTSTNWTTPPEWGNHLTPENYDDLEGFTVNNPPWNMSEEYKPFLGRRKWNINIGGLTGSDMISNYTQYDVLNNGDPNFGFPVYYDAENLNIYRDLFNHLMFGRFIFQPDTNDDKNFAICKLRGGINVERVLHKYYDVNFEIEEVW